MKYGPSDIILGILKTSGLLIFLEIFTSAFLPALGIIDFKPAFSVLIVLFLAFKLETPVLPFLILIIQYVHSIFSIEGWAIGTLTGVLVAMSVRYLKDMLHFSSIFSTMVVVQMFQLAWFIMISFMLSLKLADFSNFFHIFWRFVPESIILSLVAPFFFMLLDRFWNVNKSANEVGI